MRKALFLWIVLASFVLLVFCQYSKVCAHSSFPVNHEQVQFNSPTKEQSAGTKTQKTKSQNTEQEDQSDTSPFEIFVCVCFAVCVIITLLMHPTSICRPRGALDDYDIKRQRKK